LPVFFEFGDFVGRLRVVWRYVSASAEKLTVPSDLMERRT